MPPTLHGKSGPEEAFNAHRKYLLDTANGLPPAEPAARVQPSKNNRKKSARVSPAESARLRQQAPQ